MMNFVFQMMSFANLFSDAETKVLRLFKHFGSVVRVTVRKKKNDGNLYKSCDRL